MPADPVSRNAVEFLPKLIKGEAGITNVETFREIHANPRTVEKISGYFNKLKRKYPELKEDYIPAPEQEGRIHELKDNAVKELRHIIDMEQG